jgi:hypothetical protein
VQCHIEKIFCNSALYYKQPTSVREKNKPSPPTALKPLSTLVSIKDLQVGQSSGNSLLRRPATVVRFPLACVTARELGVTGAAGVVDSTFLHRGTLSMQLALSQAGKSA